MFLFSWFLGHASLQDLQSLPIQILMFLLKGVLFGRLLGDPGRLASPQQIALFEVETTFFNCGSSGTCPQESWNAGNACFFGCGSTGMRLTAAGKLERRIYFGCSRDEIWPKATERGKKGGVLFIRGNSIEIRKKT